jgi:hypothetical protein
MRCCAWEEVKRWPDTATGNTERDGGRTPHKGVHMQNETTAINLREFLTFTLGHEEYGIDILRVQEIRGYDAVTSIANSPPFIKGVINLRGIIVPIVDLRVKFNLPQISYDAFTVVIILNIAQRTVGIGCRLAGRRSDKAPARVRRSLRYRVPHRPRRQRRAYADTRGHRKADEQPRNGVDERSRRLIHWRRSRPDRYTKPQGQLPGDRQ